jgi:hypothetical protein
MVNNDKPPVMLGDRIVAVLRKNRGPMTRQAIARALKLFRQQIVVALSLPKYRRRFVVEGEKVTLRRSGRKAAKGRKTVKARKPTQSRKPAQRAKPAAKSRKPVRRKSA